MRQIASTAALAMLALSLAGCHSNTPATPPSASVPISGMSLAEMRAQYWKLHLQYVADCIDGSPKHVTENQALCQRERDNMAPLGDAMMAAEVKAAQSARH